MKYLLVLISAVVITSMMPPPQQEKTLTFTVTLTQANTILRGLNELPFKESADLIQSLQIQAQKQLNPITAPVKGDTTKKH